MSVLSIRQSLTPTMDTLPFPMTAITASVVMEYFVFAGGLSTTNTDYIDFKRKTIH